MTHFLQDLSSVSFFGRPFEELRRCFGLSLADMRGRSILECPSGPSSFVAEASRLGISVVGVDPLFYRSPEGLAALARSDFEEMFRRVRAGAERFVRRTYGSVDEAESARRAGLELFLSDYRSGFAAGRYLAGALPDLAFGDEAFDLVLCGHFLCIYAEQFDREFHEEAVRELCRVARREVRIHPIVNSANQRYAHLDRMVAAAEGAGFAARVEEVGHEFFRGSNETLVLRRTGCAAG